MEIHSLPQNPESEKTVLASLIYDNSLIPNAVSLLTAEDFYSTINQGLFQAIAETHKKGLATDNGMRKLTTDYALGKNRSGSDTISSYFKWDNEQKMHVSCESPAEAKGKTSCEREELITLVRSRSTWSFTELRATIADHTGKSIRTAERKIDDLVALGKIRKNDNGSYSSENDFKPMSFIHD
jgi:hypothetical protein